MTIGNIAGALAVSVLIVLSQAGDVGPPASRLPNGAVGQAPVGADPALSPGEGTRPRPSEVAPPPVAPPKISARPIERPSTRENAPGVEPLTRKQNAPAPAEQARAESPPKKESTPPTEGPPPTPPAPGAEAPPPEPARPATEVTLDLSALEKRLRETSAIGVFTKLSLKNQVDDLLEEFREFHRSRDRGLLTKLRQAYDLLLLKVLSLLQDDDPALARDISSSREGLWKILTDPDKFERL